MVITPGAILEGVALIRPARKLIRQMRNNRRLRLGKPLLPPLEDAKFMELNTGLRTSSNAGFAGLVPVVLVAPAADAIVNGVNGWLPGFLGPDAALHIAAGITWVIMFFTARFSKTGDDKAML